MKLLQRIPTDNFIAVDIETVRYVDKYKDLSPAFKEAWEYKNKQDGQIPDEKTLADLWQRMSSLYAEFSRVCAVSFAFMAQDTIYVKEIAGDNEKQVLTDVAEFLERVLQKNQKSMAAERKLLVGHAAKYFDYPFLCKRFVINRLPIPTLLDTSHLKPWENVNMDTNMDVWKMGGTGPGSSLQALCAVLDVPTSKTDLVGDEVGEAFFKGEIERISRYCTQDAIATFNVVRRVKNEPLFDFDQAKYME